MLSRSIARLNPARLPRAVRTYARPSVNYAEYNDRRSQGQGGGRRDNGAWTPQDRRDRGGIWTPPGREGGGRGRGERERERREGERERGERGERGEREGGGLRRRKPSTLTDSVVPQLSQPELQSIFSQELFVFRCDLNAAQVASAMTSYPQLRGVGVLTSDDISNLARQLHTRFRIDRQPTEILPALRTLISDLRSGAVPGHPLASVHILSSLKEMEEFDLCNTFWEWLRTQTETHTDARVYGAAIEALAYQGEPLHALEELFTTALSQFSATVIPSVARDTGKNTRLMLLQGIVTARILHGDWAAAYEGFDICTRLYPTLTPPRLYELLIYERPVREGYIVFLMACRAGSPPKPQVLTPLLKSLWSSTQDVRAMLRAVYAFVGAGGKPSFHHLNALLTGLLSSIPPGDTTAYTTAMTSARSLISSFSHAGVAPSSSTFNTIISLGGRLSRVELVHAGVKELAASRLSPTIVTYRIILNAFGELNDADSVRRAWTDLYIAKQLTREAWDDKDLRALIRACIRTSQLRYCTSELHRLQDALGHTLYRGALLSIPREEKRLESLRHTTTPSPTLQSQPPTAPAVITTELAELHRIFSSHQTHDFSRSQSEPPDIGPNTPQPQQQQPQIPESELQHFYAALTASVSPVASGEDPDQRTSTGYTVSQLRFENWRSVNRLLYEAEVHELEVEAGLLGLAKRASGDDNDGAATATATATATGEAGVREDPAREEVKKLFAGEERAKARIEAIRKGLEGARREREMGAGRREELKVRGRMGGELGERVGAVVRVVP